MEMPALPGAMPSATQLCGSAHMRIVMMRWPHRRRVLQIVKLYSILLPSAITGDTLQHLCMHMRRNETAGSGGHVYGRVLLFQLSNYLVFKLALTISTKYIHTVVHAAF